jgi:hypothetical protein
MSIKMHSFIVAFCCFLFIISIYIKICFSNINYFLFFVATCFDINIVTYSGSIHDGTLLHSKIQYTTLDYSSQLFYDSNTRITSTSSLTQLLITVSNSITHVRTLSVLEHNCQLQLFVRRPHCLLSSTRLNCVRSRSMETLSVTLPYP